MAYRVVHVAEVLPSRSHPVERIAVGGQFGYVVPLAVLFRQFVQYGVMGGGHTQQDNDCLVVLVCRQCRRFRQAFERVAHVGAQPHVLAERFKFQVVVHFPAVVQQPCYLFVQFLAGRFQLRFGSGKQ